MAQSGACLAQSGACLAQFGAFSLENCASHRCGVTLLRVSGAISQQIVTRIAANCANYRRAGAEKAPRCDNVGEVGACHRQRCDILPVICASGVEIGASRAPFVTSHDRRCATVRHECDNAERRGAWIVREPRKMRHECDRHMKMCANLARTSPALAHSCANLARTSPALAHSCANLTRPRSNVEA